jgi:hypothetical protein
MMRRSPLQGRIPKEVHMQDYRLCVECAKLQYDIVCVFEKLIGIATVQLEAFRADDGAKFARLDTELRVTIAEKERRIGALRHHRSENHPPN